MRGGSGALDDPVDDFSASSSAVEIDGLGERSHEELESRVSLDSEASSDFLLFSSIDLSEDGKLTLLNQSLSGGDVFGNEFLAVTTPRGVELNEDVLVRSEESVEVGVSQDVHTFINFGSR